MKRIAALMLALSLGGCAQIQIGNQLVPGAGQKLEFVKGAPYTRSEGKTSQVILLLKSKQTFAGDRLQLNLAAFNGGDAAFNFGLENIAVTDARGEKIELVPFEQIAAEIQAEIKRRQMAANYMAYQAMTAKTTTTTSQFGNYSGTSNFNANTYGTGGYANTYGNIYNSGTYSGHSTTTTTNPAANSAAAGAWLAQGAAARAQLEGKLSAVSESYLQTNTVGPGNSVEGYVYLAPSDTADPKQPDTYTVIVTSGGDTHTFTIQRTPLK